MTWFPYLKFQSYALTLCSLEDFKFFDFVLCVEIPIVRECQSAVNLDEPQFSNFFLR